MPKIDISQYVGGADFLESLLSQIRVVSYNSHKIVVTQASTGITAIIKGHDFTYGFSGLTGGIFKSLKVFGSNHEGRKLLLEAHVTGKGTADILDALHGKLARNFDFSDAKDALHQNGTGKSDHMLGSKHQDKLDGGKGNDLLFGGRGNDKLKGASGNDKLKGGDGEDRLTGGKGGDDLSGNSGKDRLDGDDGNDKLKGGVGNDRLNGGKGSDDLNGDAGDDRLDGGRGNDLLAGGTGKDKFVFSKHSGKDRIVDFKDDKDTLLLDSDLWKGKKSIKKVLKIFGDEHHGNVTLDFGHGDKLKIKGIDLHDLANDILIV